MPECRECRREYRGEPPFCGERCEEVHKEKFREKYLELKIPMRHCTTCGRTFHAEEHHFHRTRTDFEEERERAREARKKHRGR